MHLVRNCGTPIPGLDPISHKFLVCHEDTAHLLLDGIRLELGRQRLFQGSADGIQGSQHMAPSLARQLGEQQVARHLDVVVILQPGEGLSHV